MNDQRAVEPKPVSAVVPIRCDLSGSNTAQSGDLIARGNSPVFDLCRLLVAAGHDPKAPMECYRGETVALRVRSIGEGARLTVRETATDGPRVVRWKPFPGRAVTAPVDLNGSDGGGDACSATPPQTVDHGS